MKPGEYYDKLLEELHNHHVLIADIESQLATARQLGIQENVDKLQEQLSKAQVCHCLNIQTVQH
jgi:hypothetical protein